MNNNNLKHAPITTATVATPAEISIMCALGMKERAQYNARCRHYTVTVGSKDE
jgi:hypothetical protein